MDHLPLPSIHNAHLLVPYLAQRNPEFSYDSLGFEGFPERKGVKSQSFQLGHNASNFTEHAAIFQSWCFFGLIIDFFEAVGLEVAIEDFPSHQEKGAAYLTTHRLPWLAHSMETMTRDMHTSQRADIYCKVKPCLVTASIAVRRLAQSKVDDPIWHVVHLPVLTLGEYLTNITKFFLECTDPTPSPWWGRNNLACELMDSAGWCPTVSRSLLHQEVDQTVIYYLSRMQKHDTRNDHMDCTSIFCTLERLNVDTYKTKHTDECLGSYLCHDIHLEPSIWTVLLDIVNKEQVPLLTVVDGNQPGNIKVKVMTNAADLASSRADTELEDTTAANRKPIAIKRRYVCISHVWSDGLGNPHKNALPACQLHRLQGIVNALYGDGSCTVPFWIDTICVPLQHPYSAIAIESMRRIYKNADKVLVLDSALTKTPSQALEATEMTTTGIIFLDMREKYHRETGTTTESQLGNDRNRADEILKTEENQQCAASYQSNERIKKRIEGGDLLWWEGFHFLSGVEVLGKEEPQEDFARLRSIIHPLRWRTTSRIQDETVCLSGCLDRTTENLPQEAPSTDKDSLASLTKERMKTFLLSLRSVPVSLLFVQRPRIDEEGYRWMPTSFLGGGMDSSLPDPWQKEETPVVGRPTAAGLAVLLPGVILSGITKYTQRFAGEHTHDIIFVRIGGHAYYVYGLLTIPVQWDVDESVHLALILREEPDQRGTFACLVTMSAQSSDLNYCRFQCCVMLMGNPEIHRNLADTVFSGAVLTKATQQWCVA